MVCRISSLSLIFAFAFVGCSSEPADVAGSYTIAVTNGENGCNFDNWTVGDTAENIPVTITQDGATASAAVEGPVALLLGLLLGSATYQGEVDGNQLDLTIFGTNSATEGNCVFTYNSVLDAELTGDVLQGEIRYEAATVDNPDCAAIEGCATIQRFNGTRPPTL